jgi:hypothetical protein
MGSDRILTVGDYERMRAECEARRSKIDPRNVYTIEYDIFGKLMTEKVLALTSNDAIDSVKRTCGMVGMIPMNIKIVNTEYSSANR